VLKQHLVLAADQTSYGPEATEGRLALVCVLDRPCHRLDCANQCFPAFEPGAGNSVVILNGLRPGTYYYKFIVDGVWAIDPLAPKVNLFPDIAAQQIDLDGSHRG